MTQHNSFTPQFHPQVSTHRWVMHTKGLGWCLAPTAQPKVHKGSQNPDGGMRGRLGGTNPIQGNCTCPCCTFPNTRVGNAVTAWVGATCSTCWCLQHPGQSTMLEGLPEPFQQRNQKHRPLPLLGGYSIKWRIQNCAGPHFFWSKFCGLITNLILIQH